MSVITFDFHDTLVHCPDWFELEVRELAPAFLRWRADRLGTTFHEPHADQVRRTYRRLREAIIDHGNEQTAESCLTTVLEELEIEADDAEIAAAVEELMRETLATAELVPGAASTVRALADSGVTLAVISSAVYHPFLLWALERFEMLDAFSLIVTSASCGYYKSRTEIYAETLRSLDADPATSIHIGDSIRFDVGTARRIGMRTVWLSNAPIPDGHTGPDLILGTLEDASEAILALRERALGERNGKAL